MSAVASEAWVLASSDGRTKASLVRKEIELDLPAGNEVLAKPLYGCMEGNIVHALTLQPDNVFARRGEDEIIPGNAGVVRVESIGDAVSNVAPGDVCLYFCNGRSDPFGYPEAISAYDKPRSMGVFAKTIKLTEAELMPIPRGSKISLQRWAAFSLKYVTAWSNWKVAHACWKAQMPDVAAEDTHVFGWGGGVTFGELLLAKELGYSCHMMTSRPERLTFLEQFGIAGVDRSRFRESEDPFLEYVDSATGGRGASILVDNIGQCVYKMSMKALGRQGVITTSGWKTGGMLPVLRANECQQRHIHVFTHYATYQEGMEAVAYAETNDWAPPVVGPEYGWEEIPELLEEYAAGRMSSWFPIFRVNE